MRYHADTRPETSQPLFVAVALLCAGCDIGLVALRFDCGPNEAPSRDGGCQPTGVGQCSVASDTRGGCVMTPDDACDALALPTGDCVPLDCVEPDRRDPRFPNPRGIFATPVGSFDPARWPRLYVAPDGTAGADGSIDNPYAQLSEAIAAASTDLGPETNTLVLLAAGNYRENIEVDRPIVVWGACADSTRLEPLDADLPALSFAPGLEFVGATGFTIGGEGDGVLVTGSGVLLSSMRIDKPGGTALRATDDARVGVIGSVIDMREGNAVASAASLILVAVTSMRVPRGHGVAFDGGASLTILDSFIEHGAGGVFASGAQVTIEDTLIRSALPSVAPGQGIRIERAPTFTILRSIVERSHDAGVELVDSSGTIEDSVVRDTAGSLAEAHTGTRADCAGHGVRITSNQGGDEIAIRRSLVERSRTAGIQAQRVQLSLEHVLVRDTLAEACSGSFGDGVVAYGGGTTRVRGSRIETSARAAFASFASPLAMAETALGCSDSPLAIEPSATPTADEGSVVCGCDDSWGRCRAASPGLAPWLTSAP